MNTIMDNKNTRGLVYGVLVLLMVYLLSSAIYNFKQTSYLTNTYASFSVSGKGEVIAKPDIATFSFSITEKAPKGADAEAAMSKKAEPIVSALKSAGIAEADIQTSSYNLYPTYDNTKQGVCTYQYCPPSNPVISGYEASESFTVKVRDIAKVGDLLSLVSDKGAQNVSSITMNLDDPSKIKEQAREKAIADAMAQAKSIAKASGIRIGKITSIYEDNNGGTPPYAMDSMKTMSAGEASPSVPVEAGSQTVTSNITITFEIE